MQFGRFVAVFQQHPGDAGKTVATSFMALAVKSDVLGKKKEYESVPVLRNLVSGAGSGRQQLIQYRQLDQRRPAGLRAQPHQAIATTIDRE